MQTLYESCESVTLPSSELPPDDICVVLSEGRFNALDGLVVHTLHIAWEYKSAIFFENS